jgi:mono/diheme cytochrome c family protein
MFNRTRSLLVLALLAFAVAASGCGSQGVSVPEGTVEYEGATTFAEKCGGCHTISYAGTTGSKPDGETNTKDRTNGPNFDQRKESYETAMTAIRQGGFSGAIMPGNIVTGRDARLVATFLAKYSGRHTGD